MDSSLTYIVTICAVIFGADETILNVELGNGYIFRKMSLIPSADDLDKIFEVNSMGLRREYESARIDATLDVICIFKSYTICLERAKVEEYYNTLCDDVLNYLDDSIRVMRLFIEGAIRFKKLAVKMESEIEYISETKVSNRFSSIIPIGGAMNCKEIYKFHCEDEKINVLNNNISFIKFPLLNDLLNNCHIYYDLSYHQDNFISITLLITCLEILFLNRKDAKKEILAKRCSIFLYDSKNERVNCYKKLREAYKKRSDFVHDGESLKVKDEDILFLRDCVRKSLERYLEKRLRKKDIIQDLKRTIEDIDYWK